MGRSSAQYLEDQEQGKDAFYTLIQHCTGDAVGQRRRKGGQTGEEETKLQSLVNDTIIYVKPKLLPRND